MAKKRNRITNPEPFLDDGDSKSTASAKKRPKPPKLHQQQEQVISPGISGKILKQAKLQQKEIEEEETREQNPSLVLLEQPMKTGADTEEDDEIDDFTGFGETESQFGELEDQMDEDDEKLLAAFLSTDSRPQRTLADIIVERIKEKDAQVSSEARPMPQMDNSIIELYKSVGKLLSKYTSGKMPKAFKHIPSLQFWEEVLYLTEPEKWSPNAMYQATRIFASNLGVKKAERFYKLVLLPRVREDIRKNKRLHFALYQSLKKSLYKPAAFNKGILFPLCESRTCNLREAVIIGSILEKVSIPPLHSSVALLKMAEMEYCGTTSYFIKLLIEKKYALPYRVLDAMVAHFMRFLEDSRTMPVIWHQSLLAFVQRYKNELTKEDKDNLHTLVKNQRHYLVTPEILRELNNSRNRGEKEDDLMSIYILFFVVEISAFSYQSKKNLEMRCFR
ncbi:OLC1v1023421C1 [Oldenlandia corymbosa var. corymbosa]|uniref:Bystin n=1 Tax=Oldenlandia corymbosa var. corymbosa TaxID=529605 RepID=A0AAV1C3K7_OLDCO|nr:OLC1v1023421C1 [Oldenlandia corymbosa var. corymbosa]